MLLIVIPFACRFRAGAVAVSADCLLGFMSRRWVSKQIVPAIYINTSHAGRFAARRFPLCCGGNSSQEMQMSVTRTFTTVLGIACLSSSVLAQPPSTAITGGGCGTDQFVYSDEFAAFNAMQAPGAPMFGNPGTNDLYLGADSLAGQTAFLDDNLSCDAGPKGCMASGATVDYGASDAPFLPEQISQWQSSSVGQSASGNLIQIPTMGEGVAFPIVNASFTKNGQVAFTDDDLCGIFSAKITDWSETTAATKLASGPITVIYRTDGSGLTFLLLNHFAALCTEANSNFVLPITPSTVFAKAFPDGVPSNFVGEASNEAVANYESGLSGTEVTSAIAYLPPEYTTIDPSSDATLANGHHSALNVPAVLTGKTAYLPTVTDIALGLTHPGAGQNLTPPSGAAGWADPAKTVPVIVSVSKGYAVVGYATLDLAQCYAKTAIGSALVSFLKNNQYGTRTTAIVNNGFVPLSTSDKTLLSGIKANILGNNHAYDDNIGNATRCSSLPGR